MNDSVSVSAISTQSTRNQIDKCKELLDQAMSCKSQGKLKEYRECINNCTFIRPSKLEGRSLRLWVKAFLESINEIVTKHKDHELVDLLLYKLPWLCHGLRQGTRIKAQSFDDVASVAMSYRS